MLFVFFCKQKTAYEMRISDWSSDVCSSDLLRPHPTSWFRRETRRRCCGAHLQNKERSMRGLNGKVAIVTGATKAIGIATAERLGAEGVQVVGCGRDAESGERCAERINENGGIDRKSTRLTSSH